MNGKTGVLLFAHGARDARWAAPFEAVARQVSALRPEASVRLAFLEFMSPTLADAGAALVEDGCRVVHVVPLFLGAGGHVRKDVPQLLDELRSGHRDITFALHTAIGEHDAVIAAMAAATASIVNAS